MTVEIIKPVNSVKGQTDILAGSMQKKSQAASFSFQNMMSNASFNVGSDNKAYNPFGSRMDNGKTSDSKTNDKMATQKSEISQIVKSQKKVSAEDKTVAEDTLAQIEETVKEKFNISDEEYNQIMELLGFTTVDLLNTQNLAVFTAQVNGLEDALELLTNSDLSELFVETTKEINALLDSAGENLNLEKSNFINLLQQVSMNQGMDLNAESVSEQDHVDEKNMIQVGDSANTTVNEEIQVEVNVSKSAEENQGNKHSGNDEGAFGNHAMNHSQAVNEILSNINEQFQNVAEGFSYGVDAENIMKQIVDAVKVNINVDSTSMEMQLTPEHLGKLLLTVSAKEGVVTAEIAAQNEAVKNALESQIITLKESMNAQGIKVDAVEVTLASHGFEMGHNLENRNDEDYEHYRKATRKKNISIDEVTGEELTDEELIIQEMMRAKGNNVDYIA